MSPWAESLSLSLYDCGDDLQARTKYIFAHLSMGVPRSWWVIVLEEDKIPKNHIQILNDLLKEVCRLPGMSEQVDFAVLVAMAFVDDDVEMQEPRFGDTNSPHSLFEYVTKAKVVLTDRSELISLAEKISEKTKTYEKRS